MTEHGAHDAAHAKDRERMPQRLGAVIGLVLLAAMVCGCGPIDAGHSAAAEYREWALTVDGVVEVEAHGSNDLPFSASVSATVTLDCDLTDDELEEVLDALHEFEFSSSRHSLRPEYLYCGVGQIRIRDAD